MRTKSKKTNFMIVTILYFPEGFKVERFRHSSMVFIDRYQQLPVRNS